MTESNRIYLSAQELFDEVQPIGNVLGFSIEKKDFINHLLEFYKFNQKYHDVVNLYVFKHAEQLKDLTDNYMQKEHLTLNLAMIKARQQLIAEAQQKIVKKELHIFYPNYLKKQIISKIKNDFLTQPACSTDDILKKISDWKDAYTYTILGEQRSKTLLRRSNSDKLKIIMDDLKISSKDGARFRMALSRYKGTLNSFLNDFGKQQVPFFHSSATVSTQNNSALTTDKVQQSVDKQPSIKGKAAIFSIHSFHFPSLTPYIRKLALKKRISCGYKKITMAWKAFFYWLQNHKKIHKIKRIHFNFDWRNKIKPIQLPTAKLVYLKNNSHSLRVAAVIMPFIGLGYFWGLKLACRAEAMPASPRINYNTARDSISPLALFQAKKNFAELNDFYAPPVVRSVYKLEETSLKEQEKETKAETKKEAKKEAKKQTKKETTQQKALAKENNKKAKEQAAQPVVQNDIYYVDGMYMDLQPLNCSNVHISSRFGLRKDPFTGRGRKHYGIDYAAPSGSPIYASADGVVQSANWVRGYGQYIVIKHNDTYSTAYAHMSRFADGIKPGTKVQRGQTIGYVGSTGRSTGPHLHFEVKKHGKNIDPFILANSRDYASR